MALPASALVLLALSPLLWLAVDWGLGYHASILAATFVYGLSGLAALGVLLRGLGESSGRLLAAGMFVIVFFAVGGQTAWIMRPYLGRPSQDHVPFVRATEGGFADAVVLSARSSLGIYDEEPDPMLYEIPLSSRIELDYGVENPGWQPPPDEPGGVYWEREPMTEDAQWEEVP